MKLDKGLVAGSSTLLVLSLLEHGDLYGYQMIEELARRSNDVFQMKEGTLYPILHALEKGKYLSSYEQQAPMGRMRKYYKLTRKGRELLADKKTEWARFHQGWRMCCPAEQMPWGWPDRDGWEQKASPAEPGSEDSTEFYYFFSWRWHCGGHCPECRFGWWQKSWLPTWRTRHPTFSGSSRI